MRELLSNFISIINTSIKNGYANRETRALQRSKPMYDLIFLRVERYEF